MKGLCDLPVQHVSLVTRKDSDVCVELARGIGCLFTLNCSTTPGGYSLQHQGCQFTSPSSYPSTDSAKLKLEQLLPIFGWKSSDLSGECRSAAVQ